MSSERDEVLVVRIAGDRSCRGGIVDQRGAPADAFDELLSLAGGEVGGELGSRKDALQFVEEHRARDDLKRVSPPGAQDLVGRPATSDDAET